VYTVFVKMCNVQKFQTCPGISNYMSMCYCYVHHCTAYHSALWFVQVIPFIRDH